MKTNCLARRSAVLRVCAVSHTLRQSQTSMRVTIMTIIDYKIAEKKQECKVLHFIDVRQMALFGPANCAARVDIHWRYYLPPEIGSGVRLSGSLKKLEGWGTGFSVFTQCQTMT